MRGLVPLLLAFGCTDGRTMANQSVGTTGVSSASTSGGNTASSTTAGTTSGGTTAGPNAMPCTPFSSWCENDMLLTCTRSGMDATGYDCGRSNQTINGNTYTYHCAAQCPNQPSTFGPCCNVTVTMGGGTTGGGTPVGPVRCNVSLTSPTAVSGDTNTLASEYYCSAPSAPECPNYGTFDVSFSDTPKTCPPNTSGWRVALSIYRASVAVGATVSAASSGVSLSYTNVATPASNCSSWTGTVTFNSDAPKWGVSIDATCATNASIKIKGTFSGDVS
jgi:hypothetical protein